MKKWMAADRAGAFLEEPLTEKTFAELFLLQQQGQHRLETLRRREPREEAAYAVWIGRNAACIADLEKIYREIRSRKERADRAGVNVFAFDGKALRA